MERWWRSKEKVDERITSEVSAWVTVPSYPEQDRACIFQGLHTAAWQVCSGQPWVKTSLRKTDNKCSWGCSLSWVHFSKSHRPPSHLPNVRGSAPLALGLPQPHRSPIRTQRSHYGLMHLLCSLFHVSPISMPTKIILSPQRKVTVLSSQITSFYTVLFGCQMTWMGNNFCSPPGEPLQWNNNPFNSLSDRGRSACLRSLQGCATHLKYFLVLNGNLSM